MQRAPERTWHTIAVAEVTDALGVDTGTGLSEADVESRLAEYGPNLITEAPGIPAWRRVASLLADKMTLVLVVAAVVSAVVSREWETPVSSSR